MEVQTPLPIPEAAIQEPVLSGYTDFREYLRDFYDYKIHQFRNSFGTYNYKTFSAAADIKSPNYLKLIIEGERNLSPDTAKKFARALGLDKEGTDEFLLLIEYNQATDPLQRNQRLKDLNEFRVRRRIKSGEISEKKLDSIPKWVSWALHAAVDLKDVEYSVEGLRDLLQGKVSTDEIRRALQQLFDSQALQINGQTGQVKKGIVPPSQEEISPEMIRNIQSELMYLGMESLLNGKSSEREVGTLTVSLTESEFDKLKFELRHLRKRILRDALVAREQQPGERVYQLNFQLFPLTKKPRLRN